MRPADIPPGPRATSARKMRRRVSCASAQSESTATDISIYLEISKSRAEVNRKLDSAPVRRGWIVAGWLVLACASGTPAPTEHTSEKHAAGGDASFPPHGPVDLRPANAPAEGTLYQVLMSYDGRSEVADDRKGATAEAQTLDERTSLELDFRQVPVPAPPGDLAFSLVLEALKRRTRIMPPGTEHVIELGEDRLRVSRNDKVETDLRGAQPKHDLTPRALLGKSFALVVTDAFGTTKGVSVRGAPAAKRLLGTLPLRETLSYVQIAYPDRPVSPGDTWRATRYFPNPIGRLGLAVDVELRLVGFERIGDAPCARVSLRASQDAKKVTSVQGFEFDEVRYQLEGDAWLDLATGQVAAARIEDASAIAYHKVAAAIPTRVRMRYEGRSALQRLESLPVGPNATWADGSKRFSAVK